MPWLDRIVAEEPRVQPGSLAAYGIAVALVGLSLGIRFALGDWLQAVPFIAFAPAVIFAAFIGGLGAGLLATALGALSAWYFFMAPAWSFGLNGASSGFSLLLFLVIAVVNCTIIYAFQTAVVRLREERRKQQQLAAQLERRVAERTREIEAANAKLRDEIRERERAEAAARQAQKMEAIGQLTGGIAHDFNNLLTVILGNLDALLMRVGSGDAVVTGLAQGAIRGAERAAALTQRLLAFARQQALAPADVDVNKLVTGMSELMRRTLGEQIELETVLAGGLWRARCDPHQLETALLNLVINARDAMPSGGKLTIETANTSLDEAYAAANDQVNPGQYVMVAVSDTGSGMTPETIARAFEPFFTTKQVGQGTGLGLSMVYGFVKQSGGHVKIYSEPQHGTTLKIYLPRVTALAAEAAQSEADTPLVAGEGRILVVEDDEDVRDYAAAVLSKLGYEVWAAESGRKALDMLKGGLRIDLLFTDVVMPEMNGHELAEQVGRLGRDIRVVFTTGYSRNAIVHGGKLDSGVRLIPKPFTAAALARGIRRAMAG